MASTPRPSPDGHLGVHDIRERAELLGGTLTIESAPGHGTSLFVELPVAAEAQASGR